MCDMPDPLLQNLADDSINLPVKDSADRNEVANCGLDESPEGLVVSSHRTSTFCSLPVRDSNYSEQYLLTVAFETLATVGPV